MPIRQPIIDQLPGIYRDEQFTIDFTAGLDHVVAPAVAAIDCLDAYIDPAVCPPDFLEWLGDWVGLHLEEDWSTDRSRRVVGAAADMFAKRSTAAGLRREIELYTDGVVHIEDPGATHTSAIPGQNYTSSPDDRDRTVRVVVDVADGDAVNWAGLQELIRNALPAHLPVDIELREISDSDHDATEQRS